MSVRKGSRTKARIRAIDVIFEADERHPGVRSSDILDTLAQRQQITLAQTPLPEYSATIVAGVAHHLEEIDDAIEAFSSRNWRRMPSVDRSILRVAIWEIMFNDDVDGVVSITEAVGIADSLCAPDAPAFINAVLDRVKNSHEQKLAADGTYLDELDVARENATDTELLNGDTRSVKEPESAHVDVEAAYVDEYLDE